MLEGYCEWFAEERKTEIKNAQAYICLSDLHKEPIQVPT